MIRNSVTLSEDDAMDVVSALEELIDYINMYGDKHSRLTDRQIEELTDLKNRIERSL